MIDLEAHLWAPRELELAVVELWVGDTETFRDAYLEHAPLPPRCTRFEPRIGSTRRRCTSGASNDASVSPWLSR